MKAFTRARTLAIGATAATALVLTGCSNSEESGSTTDTSAISFEDSWVKAADSGMTAMFGTIVNDSGSDVTLTSVTTGVSPRVELHEMAPDGTGAMKMREKDGGVVVEANSSYELEPGGDHIMLFDLPAPVRAGSDVPFTFTFADGATAQFTAQVRDFTGAREDYGDGASHGDTQGEMQHDSQGEAHGG